MRELNTAEQLRIYLGIDATTSVKKAHGEKTPSHTKRGPGRYHQQGKKVEAANG